MRRRVVSLCLLATLLMGAAWAVARAKATQVYVNGVPVREQAVIQNGMTYVPLRAVAESLGCTVDYDPKAGVFVWSASLQSPHAPEVPMPSPVPNPRPVAPQPPLPGAPSTAPGVP
jgi:hypothetical protein